MRTQQVFVAFPEKGAQNNNKEEHFDSFEKEFKRHISSSKKGLHFMTKTEHHLGFQKEKKNKNTYSNSSSIFQFKNVY